VQRPLLVYGALDQDSSLIAGILSRWEAGRTVRQQLAGLSGAGPPLADEEAAVEAVLRAVERRRLLEGARRSAAQLAGEAARARLLQASEALEEAGMWLDGFDCVEALPLHRSGSVSSSAARGPCRGIGPLPMELRAPLQEAGSALASGVELLAHSGVAATAASQSRAQQEAPEATGEAAGPAAESNADGHPAFEDTPAAGTAPPRTQLPELGIRVRLCEAAFPAGRAGRGAPAGSGAGAGPLGAPADGLVGVVVAAGTLQSVHRPATLEQAWREAAGRALFRSPVLVEAPGRGCGWYDASQLCPVRGSGLAEEEASELGHLTATLRRELSGLAAHVAGHMTGASVSSGGRAGPLARVPAVVALEKKRRLEAAGEGMDVEAQGQAAASSSGTGDVAMVAAAPSVTLPAPSASSSPAGGVAGADA